MSSAWLVAYWSSTVFAVAAAACAFVPKRYAVAENCGPWLMRGGFALLTVYLLARWAYIGHPPIFGSFENSTAAAWCMLLAGVLTGSTEKTRPLWRASAIWVPALMGWGLRYRMEPVPLTISENSLWVDVHAAFGWAAFVPLVVLGTASIAKFATGNAAREDIEPGWDTVRITLSVSFIAFTGMLVTGSWYLNVLFGNFWQWGIVETISLVTWLLLALLLHAILFRHVSIKVVLVCCALMIPLVVVTFFVWTVFPGTFHFFDIPLVKPY